jgi:hypothetical protein
MTSHTSESQIQMKHYKLNAWLELPAPLDRTAYRRMLHQMSQSFVSVPQLMLQSGLARRAVIEFLDLLAERGLLTAREQGAPDSRFGRLDPVLWYRRTFHAEGRG